MVPRPGSLYMVLYILVYAGANWQYEKARFKVGVIIGQSDMNSTLALAINMATDIINQAEFMQRSSKLELVPIFADGNSFKLVRTVCKGVRAGVRAVIGPSDQMSSIHVQSICRALDIPYVDTQIGNLQPTSSFFLKIHPEYQHLNQAICDFVLQSNWTSTVLLYDKNVPAVIDLQDQLQELGVTLLSFRVEEDDFQNLLLTVKRSNILNFLIGFSTKSLPAFFRACRLRGLIADGAQFMLINTDINLHGFFPGDIADLRPFSFFQTLDPHYSLQQELGRSMNLCGQHDQGCRIDLQTALQFDSLLVIATGLVHFQNMNQLHREGADCSLDQAWRDGSSLYNYMNSVKTRGLSGEIQFQNGRRSPGNLTLKVYEPHSRYHTLGTWTPQAGLKTVDIKSVIENSTDIPRLVVVTREEPPYVMLNCPTCSKNRYSGFCIDLLEEISKVADFTYTIYTVPDKMYGVYNHDTKEWNGIVRELIDRKADIAVASMTINFARENVIDFTKPFMNLGISILFKKPEVRAAQLFSFMNPLALEIWLYILLAYFLVSLTIWIVARFSPHEWSNPHPCLDTGYVVQNDFTLANSFWFAVGTLMQQGSDLNPKAASTRIIGGIWWFFTLIIISSYTANLAAFLTVQRMATPIENAEDLAEQSTIHYGTLAGGSTMTFFRDSKIETYQKMWRYMESKEPTVFTSTYKEGVERVKEGNYAFLCESSMLDYFVQRDCNLTQIGGILDSKGYGIATPKGSRWRDKISKAILLLQEKSVMQMLYDKWWKVKTFDETNPERKVVCPKQDLDSNKASALNVVNIGGVFVVLLCGLSFAILVAILEFVLKSNQFKERSGRSTFTYS